MRVTTCWANLKQKNLSQGCGCTACFADLQRVVLFLTHSEMRGGMFVSCMQDHFLDNGAIFPRSEGYFDCSGVPSLPRERRIETVQIKRENTGNILYDYAL